MLNDVLKELHDEPWTGKHFGLTKTLAKLSERYFVKNAEKAMEKYIALCRVRLERKKVSNQARLQPIIVQGILEKIGIDVVGPIRRCLKTLEGGAALEGCWPSHCGSVAADIWQSHKPSGRPPTPVYDTFPNMHVLEEDSKWSVVTLFGALQLSCLPLFYDNKNWVLMATCGFRIPLNILEMGHGNYPKISRVVPLGELFRLRLKNLAVVDRFCEIFPQDINQN
ncbi:hypothetical protein EVAR_87948_1 [Eumeta japonica]|uniref:Integrase zinc-binding domain-containing protein n=1 Tax=Eumeta variegata TaxID=151549 RepID=A0A4C1VCM2_EUMVA|nr:hypothetical protein EVAR_87948_1 [Eumeta japonica]